MVFVVRNHLHDAHFNGPAKIFRQQLIGLQLTLMIAILWISETVPVILASALHSPFPLFEIASFAEVWPVYLKDLIWLFFGGFQLAFAVEKCGLHKGLRWAS